MKLKQNKLKVISRSLKRCFEPDNQNYDNLPYYKLVELEKKFRAEQKEIKRLFTPKTIFRLHKKHRVKKKVPAQLRQKTPHVQSNYFFQSQSQIGEGDITDVYKMVEADNAYAKSINLINSESTKRPQTNEVKSRPTVNYMTEELFDTNNKSNTNLDEKIEFSFGESPMFEKEHPEPKKLKKSSNSSSSSSRSK